MIRLKRAGLVAAFLLIALPATASAATTVVVPGQFVTLSAPQEGDPNRCNAVLTYVWPHVPGATSYRVQAEDTITGSYDDTVEPGYDAAAAAGWPPIGKNFQRTGMNSVSGPAPCPSDLNGGRWTVKVTANFDEESQVVGTVRDKDGNPLPKTKISIKGPTSTSATTNEGGAYGKKVKPGRYTVSAGKGYCVAGGSGSKCDQARSVNVKKGSVEGVDFVASDELVELSGGVLEHACLDDFCDQLVVQPAARLDVVAVARGDQAVYRGTTGEKGDYSIEVPVGAYDLTVKGRDGQDAITFPRVRSVNAAQDVRHLDFKVCELPVAFQGEEDAAPDCDRLVEVSGRVVDIEGKGYPEAQVFGPGDSAFTNAGGRFKLEVPRGRVDLTALGEINLARSSASLQAKKKKNALKDPIELQPAMQVSQANVQQIVVRVDGLPSVNSFPLEFARRSNDETLGCVNLNRASPLSQFPTGENIDGGSKRASALEVTPDRFDSDQPVFCSGPHSVTLSFEKAPDVRVNFDM